VIVCIRLALWHSDLVAVGQDVEPAPRLLDLRIVALKERSDGSVLAEVEVLDDFGGILSMAQASASSATSVRFSLRGRTLRISWYQSTHPLIGSVVRCRVVLRKPRALRNPGGFNYARWLYSRNFVATGYVQPPCATRSISQKVSEAIDARLVNSGLLKALTTGDKAGVEDAQWALFRRTGTVHLMVISGLHVGVFAGSVYWILFQLLRVSLRSSSFVWPRHAAMMLGMVALVMCAYSIGAQPAVVRAVGMSVLYTLLYLSLRSTAATRVLVFTGFLAMLFQPQSVFAQGFWLSYLAVACLVMYFAPRLRSPSFVRALVACQLVLAIGLTPWQGWIVGDVPYATPLANLLCVPVLSLVTVPFAFAGELTRQLVEWPSLSFMLFCVADMSLTVIQRVLTEMLVVLEHSGLEKTATRIGYFSIDQLLVGVLAAAALCLPLQYRWRLLSLFAWLSLFVEHPTAVPPGHFQIRVLDVGQGSAAIVDTARHRMVVDTGAAYPSGFNMLEAAVVPALRATGPSRVDLTLITHHDNDHAGGLEQIVDLYPGMVVLGERYLCLHGHTWMWDGVLIEVLVNGQGSSANERSCTLKLSAVEGSAFIAGDIGRESEQVLARRIGEVDVLLVPHHGSTSSSSRYFVANLKPRFALVSAGYRNRYGHPRPAVVARYKRHGSRVYTTAEHGAMLWRSWVPNHIEVE